MVEVLLAAIEKKETAKKAKKDKLTKKAKKEDEK